MALQDFPDSPVVKTLPFDAADKGSIPGQGARIPHASKPKNQNTKQKQCCNKFDSLKWSTLKKKKNL